MLSHADWYVEAVLQPVESAEAGYTPIKLTTVAIEAAIEQPNEAGQSLTGAYLL